MPASASRSATATALGYNQIPYDLRQQYGLNPYDNYYYGDGYLYRVDPRTMLIEQVVGAAPALIAVRINAAALETGRPFLCGAAC